MRAVPGHTTPCLRVTGVAKSGHRRSAGATASIVAWNSDGKKDLVVGELTSKIHIFLNQGTDTAPDFRTRIHAQENGADLTVSGYGASPHVLVGESDGKFRLHQGLAPHKPTCTLLATLRFAHRRCGYYGSRVAAGQSVLPTSGGIAGSIATGVRVGPAPSVRSFPCRILG